MDPRASSMSFVDDRLLWAKKAEDVRRAKDNSDRFDLAYSCKCDLSKSCFVRASSSSSEVTSLGDALGYELSTELALLGLVVVPLDRKVTPSVKDFDYCALLSAGCA